MISYSSRLDTIFNVCMCHHCYMHMSILMNINPNIIECMHKLIMISNYSDTTCKGGEMKILNCNVFCKCEYT